jgi:catechol 2,3-dioxygenase-like lactoylglutathione lyase family enzyme
MPTFRDPQINLYVRDVERSLRFYTERFGFVETFRTPAEGTPIHAEVRLGGLVLGLADNAAARAMHGIDTGDGQPQAEIAIWTDDTDAAYADLLAHGAPSLSSPHDFLGRLRSAWVADPDGNPIQIVTELH